MPSEGRQGRSPALLVWANLAIVYVVWGSTYLAIRVVVQTMPPLLSAGVRFSLAGAVLYAVLWWRRGGAHVRITRRELAAAGGVAAGLVLGGNGLVMLAERTVPSGHTALLVGSMPLWIIVLRLVAGDRVSRGTILGTGLGFIGVALLVVPSAGDGQAQLFGLLLLVAASASWATGSYLSRSLPLPGDPFLSTAVQMLAGGVLVFGAGILAGELHALDPSHFSRESLLGLVYLLVLGSLVAFTAYTWLLQNAPISLVSTYAYVNPIVAVLLGWAILNESITPTMGAGAALIIAAVAFVIRKESSGARTAARPAPGTTPAPVSAPADH